MKKKMLILGATGFIGRNLAEHLAGQPDWEVTGTYLNVTPYPHPNIHLVKADLRRTDDIERVIAGQDIVIQAAAVTSGAKDIIDNPFVHITDNAVMNSLLFRYAFEHAVPHVIFLSCSIMYHASDQPLKESDFDANKEMYPSYFGGGWNKVYFEKMSEFYSRLGRNRYTVIRHANIYGPYDKYDLEKSHVFGATMTKVLRAKDDTVVVWGAGEEERDLLHVFDLVRLIDRVIARQQAPFALYNAGSGRSISVKDLVHRIVALSGRKLKVIHDLTRPSIATKVCLDCAKAKAELDWEPLISLDEGIRRTIGWYEENILAPRD